MINWIERELSGGLISPDGKVTGKDITEINNLTNPPPVPVNNNDVYVRKCRLAGDAIDAGFGRFRTEDLPLLLEKVQGAPALVGHRKDTLGIARFFGGEVKEDPVSKISYIIPKFYWMRGHSAAEDLRVCIDGGIYSEGSIGFTFKTPTCSICGEDIRKCEHFPGQTYNDSLCYMFYDDILKVTEGSFVYRGAQPGTGFTLNDPGNYSSGMDDLPRFKFEGIWYRGYPEKLIFTEE